MQILIISPNKATHIHWTLSKTKIILASLMLLSLFAYVVFYVSQYITSQPSMLVAPHYAALDVQATLNENKPADVKVAEIYTKRLGVLQAEAIRLKAITKQMATMTGFDLSHFSLDLEPGQGGIEQAGTLLTESEFELNLSHLSDSFNKQLSQLEIMQTYLITEDAIASTIPSRRPINEGWLSSPYGDRIDPFTGKIAFHHGLDFAGSEGDGIYAVADGMVSWTGSKTGYGKTVEIDHGNGYVTRYAHSKELLVSLGEKVTKDQKIALMGSTGRSTGPHVHFALMRAGIIVNPYTYTKTK